MKNSKSIILFFFFPKFHVGNKVIYRGKNYIVESLVKHGEKKVNIKRFTVKGKSVKRFIGCTVKIEELTLVSAK